MKQLWVLPFSPPFVLVFLYLKNKREEMNNYITGLIVCFITESGKAKKVFGLLVFGAAHFSWLLTILISFLNIFMKAFCCQFLLANGLLFWEQDLLHSLQCHCETPLRFLSWIWLQIWIRFIHFCTFSSFSSHWSVLDFRNVCGYFTSSKTKNVSLLS